MIPFNPYQVLGIRRDSKAKRIKRAFRDKAKVTHPDKPGGSEQAFHDVRRAYFILQDAERREKFDQTGEIDEVTEMQLAQKVGQFILALFEKFLDAGVAARKDIDVIDAMREQTVKKIAELEKERSDTQVTIKALEKLRLRISRREAGDNVFEKALTHHVDLLREQVSKAERDITMVTAAQNELASYECLAEMVQFHSIFASAFAPDTTASGYS